MRYELREENNPQKVKSSSIFGDLLQNIREEPSPESKLAGNMRIIYLKALEDF